MVKEKRKYIISGSLAILLTFMQITGWQCSMKYGTSVHQSALARKIGMLELWQCLLAGIIEWILWSVLIYGVFSFCEKRTLPGQNKKFPKYIWILLFCLMYGIYIFFLFACYPGFYNYDIGNQLPQVMYAEVPYNAHHPLLHTLIAGGIITFGYHLYSVDLTLGVFLYCAFQMAVCAACFTYSLYFIYYRTEKKAFVIVAFLFYTLCPPVVMFAMSTTKDVLCYAVLLIGVLKLFDLYRKMQEGEKDSIVDWIFPAVFLTVSCLLRNNIIYGIIVFAVWSLVFMKVNRKKQIICFFMIIFTYFAVSKGLLYALDAIPGGKAEAMSVPFQQMARLYNEKGEDAFEEDEIELLFQCVDREMLGLYDPIMADYMKTAFWYHLDTIMENKWECLALWIRKGIQYPGVYIASFLDNTYQAWYPGTFLKDMRHYRYFDITGWQDREGKPKVLWIYHLFESFNDEESYKDYPILRMFFSIGVMFWTVLITMFYGIWERDKALVSALLLVLLVCLTSMCGPVSDVRYYLILFYLFPVCISFFGEKKKLNQVQL